MDIVRRMNRYLIICLCMILVLFIGGCNQDTVISDVSQETTDLTVEETSSDNNDGDMTEAAAQETRTEGTTQKQEPETEATISEQEVVTETTTKEPETVTETTTQEPETVTETTTQEPEPVTEEEQSGSSILVVYFSLAGNADLSDVDAMSSASLLQNQGHAETVAKHIHDIVGGDLVLVETVDKYPADDNEAHDYAYREEKKGARPKLKTNINNMDQYDTVFIGYPNWWYDMPMAMYSFVEAHDFSGKTVIPFCTHNGGGFSKSVIHLMEKLSYSTFFGRTSDCGR